LCAVAQDVEVDLVEYRGIAMAALVAEINNTVRLLKREAILELTIVWRN